MHAAEHLECLLILLGGETGSRLGLCGRGLFQHTVALEKPRIVVDDLGHATFLDFGEEGLGRWVFKTTTEVGEVDEGDVKRLTGLLVDALDEINALHTLHSEKLVECCGDFLLEDISRGAFDTDREG